MVSATPANSEGGFEDCNGVPGDGCEIDIDTNVNNCGACGNVCDIGVSCTSGVCGPAEEPE